MSAPKRLLVPSVAADDAILSREQAQAIIERALGWSKADAARVNVNSGHEGNVRFAANQMSTSGAVENATVAITSAFGPKHAVVSTNDFSDDGLRRAVVQSEALARLAPDDPESLPELGAQQYPVVDAWSPRTAALTPAERAAAAMTALAPARRAGDLQAAGFIVTTASSSALGNSAG